MFPVMLQETRATLHKTPATLQETRATLHFATRLMTSDKSLSHDRLQKSGLTTLETRRLRGDLIEVFKMFNGFDNIALNDFFKLSSTTLRGHTLKIYKPQVHLDVRNFFFC